MSDGKPTDKGAGGDHELRVHDLDEAVAYYGALLGSIRQNDEIRFAIVSGDRACANLTEQMSAGCEGADLV